MKRIVRLTESDLTRIVRRVIMEQATSSSITTKHMEPMMGETTLSVSMSKDPKTGKVSKIILTGKGTGGKYRDKATLTITTNCLTKKTVARITSPDHNNAQTTADVTRLQELSDEFEPVRNKYCGYTLK